VKAHAIKLQKIEDGGIKGERSALHKSISEQLKSYIDENPEEWEQFKSGQIPTFGAPSVKIKKGKGGASAEEVKGGFNLTFKAAGTMTQSAAIIGYPNAMYPRRKFSLVLWISRAISHSLNSNCNSSTTSSP